MIGAKGPVQKTGPFFISGQNDNLSDQKLFQKFCHFSIVQSEDEIGTGAYSYARISRYDKEEFGKSSVL